MSWTRVIVWCPHDGCDGEMEVSVAAGRYQNRPDFLVEDIPANCPDCERDLDDETMFEAGKEAYVDMHTEPF